MRIKVGPSQLTSIGITLIIIAVILIGWFLLRGETTVTGTWNNDETTKAITCEIDNIKYDFISTDNANSKNAKISATFDSNNNLASLSFIYRLYYNDFTGANDSKNANHANMNINFGEDKLGADAFNARYSVQDNVMQMNLYITNSDLNTISSKYFLLDEFTASRPSEENITSAYEKLGFKCTQINQ